MTPKDLALCLVFALALPIGQVMFKWAAMRHASLTGPIFERLLQNPQLFGAFALYGACSVLWVYILTRVPLSLAYPVAILGSGLVPLLAWAAFREPIGWRMAAGYALMLTGLVLTQQRPSI